MKITWKTKAGKIQAQVNYGVFDSKGRELGHELTINTKRDVFQPDENGNCICVEVDGIFATSQSTRNGVEFGASFPKVYSMLSIEEAKEFLLKQVLKFQKQIKAKASKNGGIYK